METTHQRIVMAHGGGGQLTEQLIQDHILAQLGNETLDQLGDSAALQLDSGSICFTTDSYVIKPLFFSGGDIGKLAVCGTVNDLAVAGAKPVALSLALILEEGLELAVLDKILSSIGETAQGCGVSIVTGDTKTVEAGSVDKLFINTAGIGVRWPAADLGLNRVAVGDKIIVSGTLGDHGMTIMSQREDISFQSPLASDCACLSPLIERLVEHCDGVKFMRDPTRGGLAATLNEVVRATGYGMEIIETALPVHPTVQAAADMLGFDILNIANEGKCVVICSPDTAKQCLDLCRSHPLGQDAALIGEIVASHAVATVELKTRIGGRRIVQMPYGRELPRIC